MKSKNKAKKKRKEIKLSKMFPLFAGIVILCILCSDVF